MIVKLSLKNDKEGETVFVNIQQVTHMVDIGDGCVRLYFISGLKTDVVVDINQITAIWDGSLYLSKNGLEDMLAGEPPEDEGDGTMSEEEIDALLSPGNSSRLHVNYARALAGRRM